MGDALTARLDMRSEGTSKRTVWIRDYFWLEIIARRQRKDENIDWMDKNTRALIVVPFELEGFAHAGNVLFFSWILLPCSAFLFACFRFLMMTRMMIGWAIFEIDTRKTPYPVGCL